MMAIPYRTKDLNEAAFLWCQPGTKLEAVEPQLRDGASPRNKPETFFFRFAMAMADEDFKKLMFDYANNDCMVEPQTFVQKQNNLRDRLYAVRRKFPQNKDRV